MIAYDEIELRDLLTLEQLDDNEFRANLVFDEEWKLYGGQVAAQALLAAGRTVDVERRPHSFHGYFLRPGSASLPTRFEVFRDRDGGSFSARRVVAVQEGKVIFNASMSFQRPDESPVHQVPTMPATTPGEGEYLPLVRLFSCEGRRPAQPEYEGADPGAMAIVPVRYWTRCTDSSFAADPLLDACAITYLSDMSTGLAPFIRDGWHSSSSLDHAIWFHHPGATGDWILNELQPVTTSGGRGTYTGQMFRPDGLLVASFAQECLYRHTDPR